MDLLEQILAGFRRIKAVIRMALFLIRPDDHRCVF
jgi:hypothetical protein